MLYGTIEIQGNKSTVIRFLESLSLNKGRKFPGGGVTSMGG